MGCGALMVLAVSFFLVYTTEPMTRCEAPAVYEHKPAKITCHYDTDVYLAKMDFTVFRFGEDNQYTVVLHCVWVSTEHPNCKVEHGYTFDGKIGNTSDLLIASATRENEGRYVCQVIPSDPADLVWCNFTVIDLQLNNKTEKKNSTAGNDEHDGSQTGMIAGVIAGLIACVIIAVVITIVWRKSKRSSIVKQRTAGVAKRPAAELTDIHRSVIDGGQHEDPSVKPRGTEDKQAFSVNSGPTAETPLLHKSEEECDSRGDRDTLSHKSQEQAPPVPPRTHQKTEENNSETEQFSGDNRRETAAEDKQAGRVTALRKSSFEENTPSVPPKRQTKPEFPARPPQTTRTSFCKDNIPTETKNQNPKIVKKTSTRFSAETSGQTDPLSRLSLNLDQARKNHSKTDLGKQSHISHLSDSRSKPFVHSTRKPNETHFTGVMSSNRENVTDARRSLELSGTDGSSGPPSYPTGRSPPAGQNQIDQVKQNYNKTDYVQQHYNRHQYHTQIEANNDNVPGVNSVGAKAWNTCTKRPTPLHEACRNGDESAVKDLLSSNASVDAVDDAGQTPLHVACQNGSTFVVKLLLDARARTDVKDRQGCTPLHVGCKTDSASVVEMLLRAGANTKEKDIKGCTPLHVACQNNATPVVNSLLRVGASTEARNDDSYTPLHVACLLGRRALVEMLLKHRANIEAGDKTGRTPLHVASETEHVSVVECLLKAGADVNVEDKLRRTPLLVACQNRRETTAGILIRSGAKVEVKSSGDRTPLHAACQSGSASAAKLLLDAGANTESTDTSGYTPLHFACESGEPSVVNLLLSFCASTGARTRFGHTPLDIARDAGKEAVCQILLDAAANH